MTPARAGQASAFKRCCMKRGKFDGINRDYYFQRVEEMGSASVRLAGFFVYKDANAGPEGEVWRLRYEAEPELFDK